jgi:hypothetical protein
MLPSVMDRLCGLVVRAPGYRMEMYCVSFKATTGLVPIGYRGALLSSLLQVNVYVTHNLLNVLVQIANKMGLKKKCFL